MLKQCQDLKAKVNMTLRVHGSRGRPVTVKVGDMFWITTANNVSIVKIDRKGKGVISHGYAFDPVSLLEYFDVV